jgi:hypothetical protein
MRLVNTSPYLSLPDLVNQKDANPEFSGEQLDRLVRSSTNTSDAIRVQLDVSVPSAVLGMGRDLQMGGIDASRNEAEVIDFHTFGDRADFLFVHRAMEVPLDSVNPDKPVATIALSGLRDPAGRLVAAVRDFVVAALDVRAQGLRAARYAVHQGLTSLVEVARMGRRIWSPSAPLYLGMKTKEV